ATLLSALVSTLVVQAAAREPLRPQALAPAAGERALADQGSGFVPEAPGSVGLAVPVAHLPLRPAVEVEDRSLSVPRRAAPVRPLEARAVGIAQDPLLARAGAQEHDQHGPESLRRRAPVPPGWRGWADFSGGHTELFPVAADPGRRAGRPPAVAVLSMPSPGLTLGVRGWNIRCPPFFGQPPETRAPHPPSQSRAAPGFPLPPPPSHRDPASRAPRAAGRRPDPQHAGDEWLHPAPVGGRASRRRAPPVRPGAVGRDLA